MDGLRVAALVKPVLWSLVFGLTHNLVDQVDTLEALVEPVPCDEPGVQFELFWLVASGVKLHLLAVSVYSISLSLFDHNLEHELAHGFLA